MLHTIIEENENTILFEGRHTWQQRDYFQKTIQNIL